MTLQNIAVFGGTGMTGQCAVKHALERGLKVRMLIRDEKTVPESFKGKVELITGDVTNLADVETTIKGTDAVCIVLGTRNSLAATTEMSRGTQNVVDAMKKLSIDRVSVCLSSFLFYEPEKVPKMFLEINTEHKRMLDIVKGSDLKYRAILPPHIADEPSAEYQLLHDKSPGRTISKLDLGAFLIDSLEKEEHSGKVIGIATIKKE